MAPSPEYDKEPKAPDKTATNISSEDSKLLHNLVNDQHHSSDHKTTNTATNSEVENNKHVETLDDDKLRALLNEALTYKCPKDREGKSSLFKVSDAAAAGVLKIHVDMIGRYITEHCLNFKGSNELLEEVEQDDQEACEAAARTLTGCRGSRRGARGGSRPALPHSNSLQDLVAALAAEPAPRRHRHHATPAERHNPSTVAARALHGGSLPSGVDTSSMLSEEGGGAGGARAGYLATVRCVNPPPLAERRVSASDANAPADLELLNRRSKPMFPMTYTARATLEIGSGSVCSGRAVTTTTASNQVRSVPHPPAASPRAPSPLPARARLLSAICPEYRDAGGGCEAAPRGKAPRGPRARPDLGSPAFVRNVDVWYEGLAAYDPRAPRPPPPSHPHPHPHRLDDRPLRGLHSERHQKRSLYYDTHDSGRRHSDENAYRVVKYQKMCDSEKSDISIRKTYREIIVPHVIPNLPPINPKNIKSMSIGEPSFIENVNSPIAGEGTERDKIDSDRSETVVDEVPSDPSIEASAKEVPRTDTETNDTRIDVEREISESTEDQTSKCFQMSDVSSRPAERARGAPEAIAPDPLTDNDDIELEEIVCHRATGDRDTGSFTAYLADQEKLLRVLEATDSNAAEGDYTADVLASDNEKPRERSDDTESERDVSSESDTRVTGSAKGRARSDELVVRVSRREERAPGDRYILAELPNNAYVFLTLPKRAGSPAGRARRDLAALDADAHRKKKDKPPVGTSSSSRRKDAIDKNALRALLFENLLKSDRGSPPRAPAGADTEVDSAIPFSCITTPEVVASCNTTPSAAHAAAAALPADPKPLESGAASPAPAAPPPPADRPDPPDEQPRGVIASSFNGLPLARPGFGAAPQAAGDDYKKSLDENGNSVQGYGSPLSGSSQHKKPRRKKSSKNETVIDCRQIDGYQGHKDVNELLRFIESDRAPKLRKHKDDSDDKGKKRSADRRKHHENKPARASSLEEVSRTTLEELTEPAKPERRSWGEAAPPAPDPPPAEHADFQTVTKKRKPRRRTEEAAPRRARAPSPRPADSAPPSDRSNDSNDDMDSVHSLPERERAPPPAAPPQPHASYADIARTRHNIPDLIESCNFYTEGERRRAEPSAARAPDPPPDTDSYPALDGRAEPPPAAAAPRRPARDKPSPPAARRKERAPPPAAPAPPADCPAPDVVADRRPPVILLDSAARPRDMDGVTFGFDINEQLLGGGARRPRCDLVRDAVEAAPPPAPAAPAPALGPAAAVVPVRAAKRALRYVPPPPPLDHTHLHQIVDFVGGAWEDVVKCGSGKLRYFSE